MINKSCIFINPRPELTITNLGSKKIGRCLVAGKFKVTSTRKLTLESLLNLWSAGLLGVGQSFQVISKIDGKEEPVGYDEVSGTMIDRFSNVLDEPPTNYFGNPVLPHKFPYYEYITSYQCDSSD